MTIPMYLVDAFATEAFKGNPATVCVMKKWPENPILRKMAQEHNQSETAFVKAREKLNHFDIRWFSSLEEVDLCGHATLAASHIIFTEGLSSASTITLHTRESGDLIVSKKDEMITMDMPLRKGSVVPTNRDDISGYLSSLGTDENPVNVFEIHRAIYFVFENSDIVNAIEPDFQKMAMCDKRVGITAPANDGKHDCVSRFFAPGESYEEDPVTGSAHCSIAPYWAEKLNKNKITALQSSTRSGVLECEMRGDRVYISGCAKTYFKGYIL